MADTPKYGGNKIDLLSIAGKVEDIQPVIAALQTEVKATESLAAAEEQVSVVERAAIGTSDATAVARQRATSAIIEESRAHGVNAAALAKEADALAASTAAWEANAAAKRAAASVPVTGAGSGGGPIAPQLPVAYEQPRDPRFSYPQVRNLQFGGLAGGSNDARYASAGAEKYIVKSYGGDANRVASELLANRIYQELGIPTMEAAVARLPGFGKNVGLAAKFIEGGEAQKITSPHPAISQGLAADALLGNWDVFGFEGNAAHENVLWRNGQPIRIDQGGTLGYKGMTGNKPFEPVIPPELLSLPQFNPEKYGSVSEADLRAQAAHVASVLTPQRIGQLVKAAPFTDLDQAKELETALNGRIAALDQFAKGLVDIEGHAIKQVQAIESQAAKPNVLAGAQRDLLSAYNLNYGEQHALFTPFNQRPQDTQRFYYSLKARGLLDDPKWYQGGAGNDVGFSPAGEAVRAAYQAHLQQGGRLDPYPTLKTPFPSLPGVGYSPSFDDVRRVLGNQPGYFGSNKPQLTAAREAIAQRSREALEAEKLIDEQGNLNLYRTGAPSAKHYGYGVTGGSIYPFNEFENAYEEGVHGPLKIKAADVPGYVGAVPGEHDPYGYEGEVAIRTTALRKAIEATATEAQKQAALKAIPGSAEKLGGLSPASLQALQVLANPAKNSYIAGKSVVSELTGAGLANYVTGKKLRGGAFELSPSIEGNALGSQLRQAEIFARTKELESQHAAVALHPNAPTPEQLSALESVAQAQARITGTGGYGATQVRANDGLGSATIRLTKSMDETSVSLKAAAEKVAGIEPTPFTGGGAGGGGGEKPPIAVGGAGGGDEPPERRASGLAALSVEEQAAVLHSQALMSTWGDMDATFGRVNSTIRLNAAELAASSSALQRHGALSTEFIGALARGEVTLREFGDATVATIGKFGGWALAGGLIYGAYDALKRVGQGAKDAATEATALERVKLPDFSRRRALGSYLDISRELNVPIKDVGQAQFYAARAGFRTQPEVESVSRTAIEAQKLDEVPIQDATKALGALKVAFGLNATQIHRVFEELDVGQLRFNARLNQTLPQLGRAASAVANAGGDVHELAQQLIVVTGATGGGGGQGGGNPATFFLREAGNVRKPTSRSVLAELGFNPEDASKDITKFNKELAERAGDFTKQQRLSLAQAIGGGTAIGGRYAIALINAGPSGRLREVEQQAGNPGDALQQDLGRKLAQLDERTAAVGTSLERFGEQIGNVGLTTVAESTVSLFTLLGGGLEHLANPLGAVGSIVEAIPGPLQEAGIALLALSLGARRFGDGLGLTKPLGEAAKFLPFGDQLQGYINTPDRAFIRDARRTLSEEGSRNQKRIEGLTGRLEGRGPELNEAAEREDFYRKRVEGRPPEYFATPEGQTNVALADEATKRRAQLELQNQSDAGRLAREQEARVENERLQAITRDRSLTRAQQAGYLQETGFALASGSGGIVRGAEGPLGARYQALLGAGQSGAYFPASSRIGKEIEAASRAQLEAAAGSATAGASFELAIADIDKQFTATSVKTTADLKTGFEELVAGIQTGAVEVRESLGALALGIASRGALGSVGGGVGGLLRGGGEVAAGAGGLLSAILPTGTQLFRGLNTALIGSLATELVGNAVGGGAGKAISSIGGDAAIGAGLGFLTPFPVAGPVIGGLVGGTVGALSDFLEGGGPSDTQRAQKARESSVRKEQESYEAALQSGEAGRGQLQVLSEEFSLELETAFGEDTQAAESAQKNIDKAFKVASAKLKLFGTTSSQGKAVSAELGGQIAQLVKSVAEHPDDAHVELLEKGQETLLGQARSQFQEELKRAKTPAAVASATDKFSQTANLLRREISVTPRQNLADELRQEEEHLRGLEAPNFSGQPPLQLHKKTKGRGATGSQLETRQVAANQETNIKRAEEYQKQIKEEQEDLERIQSRRSGLTLGASPFAGSSFARPSTAVGGGQLKQLEKEERAKNEKIAQLSKESREFTALQVTHPFENDAALFAHFQAVQRQIAKLKQEGSTLNGLTGRLAAELEGLVEQEVLEPAFSQINRANESRFAKELAKAGPDPARKQAVKDRQEKETHEEYEREARKLTGKGIPAPTREKEETAKIEQGQEAFDRARAKEAREEAAALARVPSKDAAARQAIQARYAAQKARILKAHPGKSTREALEEAETEVASVQTQGAEKVASEAESTISAEGALAQARDAGNAIRAAKDAVATARREVGAATTPAARINAEAQAVSAERQVQQAEQQRIEQHTALQESETADPVRRAKLKVAGDRKLLKHALGPDETEKRRTALNNDIRSEREARITEEEDVIKSGENLQRISSDQAVQKLQRILARLKAIKAAPAQIRKAEEEIFQLQQGNEHDFAVGSLRLSPTLFDAAGVAAVAKFAVRNAGGKGEVQPGSDQLPTVVAVHHQPITSGVDHAKIEREVRSRAGHSIPKPIFHVGQISIVVNGANPGHFASEMERVFGSLTRAQMRGAGLA